MPKLNKDKCFYCEGCSSVCQFDAISVIENRWSLNEEKCTNCGDCIKICPVGAIED